MILGVYNLFFELLFVLFDANTAVSDIGLYCQDPFHGMFGIKRL